MIQIAHSTEFEPALRIQVLPEFLDIHTGLGNNDASNSCCCAGCTGDLMSLNQFKSWVAIVFGEASPEDAEEGPLSAASLLAHRWWATGIGQLLLASGIEFGCGKEDPEVSSLCWVPCCDACSYQSGQGTTGNGEKSDERGR